MKLAKFNKKAEIFYTIQGEGKNIGRPSIFIRTSLCNLHCSWCDTDYTWNWIGTPFKHEKDAEPGYKKYSKSEYIVQLSVDEIAEELSKINCKNIVLTGGEPLLQQSELLELMHLLRKNGPTYRFETETNGTILPSEQFDNLIDQYNVSPKLKNSNNPLKMREKPEVYKFFSGNAKAVFKFVVSSSNDLDEILDLIARYAISPERVYLMPEGTSTEKLQAKQQWLINECKNHHLNYTDRLHIHIYGNKRGV
ncbi:7-carboxy-7-deazaguanine synthase QueE [Fulvivirga sp. 29W222]|uniref:7-carboxy-7-deazaguanine synthase n=1 Tax=Fulvivirga marina TaxID=2494733 RepID=A0A937FWU3_9BACT|nr:7-carboxy-7-deazaguanine synthase QueE [Fulvivirga marina]MBL6445836.1 7-carboxy-7-deazaguanine synthase QueE [Fulvivirga marina]